MLKLSDEQRGRLLGLKRGMGYQDLLDIGEKLCQIAETELLKMNRATGATAEQILSAQEQCRAQRVFFERLQIEIEQQIMALIENQEAPFAAQGQGGQEDGPAIDMRDAAEILGMIPEMETEI